MRHIWEDFLKILHINHSGRPRKWERKRRRYKTKEHGRKCVFKLRLYNRSNQDKRICFKLQNFLKIHLINGLGQQRVKHVFTWNYWYFNKLIMPVLTDSVWIFCNAVLVEKAEKIFEISIYYDIFVSKSEAEFNHF